MRERLTIDKM